jgi:hypothetical protein
MRVLIFASFFVSLSCNYSNHDSVATKDSTKIGEDTSVSLPPKNDAEISTNDTIIEVQFPAGKNSIAIKGQMRGVQKPFTVIVPVKKGQTLLALLVAQDSIANVRINQIFMPDGKADGPFGRELSKTIPADGDCKIIISENMMQGEEWKGKFTLSLRLE